MGITAVLFALVLARAPSPAGSPAPQPTAAPAPADGTYVYAIWRGKQRIGTTRVAVFRQDMLDKIELYESGSIGYASVQSYAAFRYDNLLSNPYEATYRAPFRRNSNLGGWFDPKRAESRIPFDAPRTLRYYLSADGAYMPEDGIQGGNYDPIWSKPRNERLPRYQTVLEAPFMTGNFMLPAIVHARHDAAVLPVSYAFGANGAMMESPIGYGSQRGDFASTPQTDRVLRTAFSQTWYDPKTFLVHEVHWPSLRMRAQLVSYDKSHLPPAPPVTRALAALPPVRARSIAFRSADGTRLEGTLTLPVHAALRAIAVLVPPGSPVTRDITDDGPYPLGAELAARLAQHGIALLRYDQRGIGKSGGTYDTQTFQSAAADLNAAVSAASALHARIVLIGIAAGADMATLEAAHDSRVARIALILPSVMSYSAQLTYLESQMRKVCPKSPISRFQCALFKQRLDALTTDLDKPDKNPGVLEVHGRWITDSEKAWIRSSRGFDPIAAIRRVPQPALVLEADWNASVPRAAHRYLDAVRMRRASSKLLQLAGLQADLSSRTPADHLATDSIIPYRVDPRLVRALVQWALTASAPAGAPSARKP